MSRRLLALAVCWVLVNAASVTHSAWSFAQLERSGWWWLVGVVAAVGTDAGMAALTWLAMERRREQRSFGWPVLGVLIAGGAVAYANVDHALGVVGAWPTLTWWVRSRVLVLSLVLPSLTVLMSALVEHEHASEDDYEDEADEREVERAWAAELARREHAHDERMAALKYGRWVVPVEPTPARAPTASASDDERLAAARAHVTTHGFTTDADVSEATGVPRSTIGRWRRAGLLTPTQEAAHA